MTPRIALHHHTVVVCMLLLLAAVAGGCASDGDVDKKLVAAYADVLVARYSHGDTTSAGSVFDSVAVAHGYTPEDMHSQLRALASNYKGMKSFYDSVSVRLDSLRRSAIEADKRR